MASSTAARCARAKGQSGHQQSDPMPASFEKFLSAPPEVGSSAHGSSPADGPHVGNQRLDLSVIEGLVEPGQVGPVHTRR